MSRDREIKRAFEIADDGMQGVIGYFYYVKACQNLATQSEIVKRLPIHKGLSSLQITHEWRRHYDPQELYQVMQDVFLLYHARIALISLISNFEGALKNFIVRLVDTKKIKKLKRDNYKERLIWAFGIARQSTYGEDTMINRIPDLCIDVDHARRIRNLWMHNNGLFDEGYGDVISVNGRQPIIDPQYYKFLKNKKQPVLVVLNPDVFEQLSCSHIELLHDLHDTIQRKYFGQKISYEYKLERKIIEWRRLLLGV